MENCGSNRKYPSKSGDVRMSNVQLCRKCMSMTKHIDNKCVKCNKPYPKHMTPLFNIKTDNRT